MKKLFLILLFATAVFAQQSQLIVEANSNYLIPVASFSDRYDPAVGASILFGVENNSTWNWFGKFEYMKFDNINDNSLTKKINYTINDQVTRIDVPLPKLEMQFNAAGLSLESRLKIFHNAFFSSKMILGFGFIYWEHKRGGYYDSLYTTIDNQNVLVDILEVPSKSQNDWSGVANIGLNCNLKIIEPVWLNASGNYKMIIGELWPTLALGLETVSVIQMFDIRGGIQIRL